MSPIAGPALPLLSLAWPLLLGLAAAWPGWRDRALWVLPAAPLPALALAVFGPDGETAIPGLLLGAVLVLDAPGRLLLGIVALIWTASGAYALGYFRPPRGASVFAGFWCLTLAGNLGVMLAADVATFYVAFAAVSLAAYWLVVHDATRSALAAGRVYMVLTLLGEASLLIGLLLGAAAADSLAVAAVRAAIADRPSAQACLILGFGLKAGMLPLHMWLPLAHPAAPTPASAALSGAIVKAGIIGLARFLADDGGSWGGTLILIGLGGAYAGIVAGLMQQNAKAALAYSTISQMGLVIAALGSGQPGAAVLYAAHHGLAKAALFLAIGVLAASGRRHLRWTVPLAALAALSLAGLPLSGGALVKAAIKPGFAGWQQGAATLSSVGTALLLGHTLRLAARGHRAAADARPEALLWAPLAGLTAATLVLPWLAAGDVAPLARAGALGLAALWDGTWPLLAAAALAGLALLLPAAPSLPPGDLIVPLGRASRLAVVLLRRLPEPPSPRLDRVRLDRSQAVLLRLETMLLPWRRGGLAAVLLVLLLALTMRA